MRKSRFSEEQVSIPSRSQSVSEPLDGALALCIRGTSIKPEVKMNDELNF
jgi:hypothetical protein